MDLYRTGDTEMALEGEDGSYNSIQTSEIHLHYDNIYYLIDNTISSPLSITIILQLNYWLHLMITFFFTGDGGRYANSFASSITGVHRKTNTTGNVIIKD